MECKTTISLSVSLGSYLSHSLTIEKKTFLGTIAQKSHDNHETKLKAWLIDVSCGMLRDILRSWKYLQYSKIFSVNKL